MTNRLAIYHYYDVILRCEGLPLNIPVCCLKWIVSRWISTRCATGNWNKYHSIQIHAELSCVWSVFNACIYIQFAFRLQFATEFTPYLHKVISLSLYPTPPFPPFCEHGIGVRFSVRGYYNLFRASTVNLLSVEKRFHGRRNYSLSRAQGSILIITKNLFRSIRIIKQALNMSDSASEIVTYLWLAFVCLNFEICSLGLIFL